MKFSFIIPYYNRLWQLIESIESIQKSEFSKKEYEIIIVEDGKATNDQKIKLRIVVNGLLLNIKIKIMNDIFYNPSKSFNEGVRIAKGDYLIITNPEIVHKTDILSELEKQFNKTPDAYVICSCVNVLKVKDDNNPEEFGKWYQHSKYRPLCYHFCSSISRKNYNQVGGFDERFNNGVGYDDNAFRDRIFSNGIEFIQRDDLLTYHLPHDRTYTLSDMEYIRLTEKNKKLYETYYKGVWNNGKFRNKKYDGFSIK